MKRRDAAAKRDLGMHRALEKADRSGSGWSDRALFGLLLYLGENDQPFLVEQARYWCELYAEVEPPENLRAWGSVIQKAAKNGYIRKVGYAIAKSSNLSPKVLWEAI